jgi:hypothetical protein
MGERSQGEWLTAAQVRAEYGFSRSAVYGSITKQVRTRKVPGASTQFNRADLDALCAKFTTLPDVPAPAPVVAVYQQRGRRDQLRPAVLRPQFLSLAN